MKFKSLVLSFVAVLGLGFLLIPQNEVSAEEKTDTPTVKKFSLTHKKKLITCFILNRKPKQMTLVY
ncbi:hypothetical protein [Virgibacillus salexigens]|uniref:hypothetical protein n=1 Tax=Virgibacillus salexigens TaxID=61016 RepID=UPI0030812C69